VKRGEKRREGREKRRKGKERKVVTKKERVIAIAHDARDYLLGLSQKLPPKHQSRLPLGAL